MRQATSFRIMRCNESFRNAVPGLCFATWLRHLNSRGHPWSHGDTQKINQPSKTRPFWSLLGIERFHVDGDMEFMRSTAQD